MAIARETVRLGLAARGAAKIKVRQPLHEAVVVAAGRERDGDRAPRRRRARGAQRQGAALRRAGRRARLLRRSSRTTARSGRASARRCRRSPAAVAALDPAHVAAALRDGRARRRHHRRPRAHARPPTTCSSRCAPLEGYQLEREGSHAVALELAIDDEPAPRGPRARDRPRRPARAQGRRPGRRRPHRAVLGGDEATARRRARARGLPRGRGAGASVALGDGRRRPAHRREDRRRDGRLARDGRPTTAGL